MRPAIFRRARTRSGEPPRMSPGGCNPRDHRHFIVRGTCLAASSSNHQEIPVTHSTTHMHHDEQMLDSHPRGVAFDKHAVIACIQACLDCAVACTACADACSA